MNAKKKQEQIWTDITVESRQMDHDIKLIVETLLDVETVEDKEEIEIPVYLFRHTDWSSYNEKEQKFIRDTLSGFECGEDYTSPTKDIKKAYKEKLGYSEDSLNTFRSAVFSESAWEKGKKDVKGLRIR